MKRILLFVLTNLAVVLVLGVVASLLGVNRYLTANGLNLGALLGFALIMGFGGAIISLLISKPVAKWSSGVRVIDAPFHARGPIATAGGCLASQYLATWLMVRGAGIEAASQALHYAAPVGEKDRYVARLLEVVRPFLPDAVA